MALDGRCGLCVGGGSMTARQARAITRIVPEALLWTVLVPALDVYDWLYLRYWRPQPVGPVLYVDRRIYRGAARRFPDGTLLRPGDAIGELHLHNRRARTILATGAERIGFVVTAANGRAPFLRTLFFHLLLCRYHAHGLARLPEHGLPPRELWLTTTELRRRYGAVAAQVGVTPGSVRALPRGRP